MHISCIYLHIFNDFTGFMHMGLAERWLRRYRQILEKSKTDPIYYCRHRLGFEPTWQQAEILEAIVDEGAKVSVRSGHGIGKTRVLAVAILWFLETRPHSVIPCTAPTANTLKDKLWREIGLVMRRADERFLRPLGFPPELWFENCIVQDTESLYDASSKMKMEWHALARTSRKEKPDALQGFHAADLEVVAGGRKLSGETVEGRILFIIEEASGVPDAVFEVAKGALSTHGSRVLLVGNPVRRTGYFAETHLKEKGFTALHFRSSDSPLVEPTYRDDYVKEYGAGSNAVRVRCDGEFPKQDNDVLIPYAAGEEAITRDPYHDEAETILGVDPARFGDDRTAYLVRKGRDIIHIEIYGKESTQVTAKRTEDLFRKYQCGYVCVDGIGIGGGVVDTLNIKGVPVVEVTVSESAPPYEDDLSLADDTAYQQTRIAHSKPRKLRDWLWLRARDALTQELPSFYIAAEKDPYLAEKLADELTRTRYGFDTADRLVVESKDAMKSRGLKSPNIADAFCLTYAPFRTGGQLTAGAGGSAFSRRDPRHPGPYLNEKERFIMWLPWRPKQKKKTLDESLTALGYFTRSLDALMAHPDQDKLYSAVTFLACTSDLTRCTRTAMGRTRGGTSIVDTATTIDAAMGATRTVMRGAAGAATAIAGVDTAMTTATGAVVGGVVARNARRGERPSQCGGRSRG